MKDDIPRLRMFAGPNGSGKTTIKSVITAEMLGIYINPDEIENDINNYGFLNFQNYEINPAYQEVLNFLIHSPLLINKNLTNDINQLQWNENKLVFNNVKVNSYFASVIADFIRRKLVEEKKSFTFETVMSSSDKIQFLSDAQKKGYRTYLYYIATDDPGINISRIQYRVKMGGHAVTEDKIVKRYQSSIELLREAIKFTNRAYIFDNSTQEYIWLAEITDGKLLEIKNNHLPLWFRQAILDQF